MSKCPVCGLALADPPNPDAKELPKPEDLQTTLDAARREWERQWEAYEARNR